jgi:Zn finger protein HypA/HybF involved in hydrogenase expression
MELGADALGRPVHELSVCQALLKTGHRHRDGPRRGVVVEHITIEAGPLSGVEPGLIASAFEILRASNFATAQALLSIESPEVIIRCSSMQHGIANDAESPRLPPVRRISHTRRGRR